MNNDERIIQNLFDEDKTEVPESLSKWNIMSEININGIKQDKVKKVSFKKLSAYAACFIMIIVAVAFSISSDNGRKAVDVYKDVEQTTVVEQIENYTEQVTVSATQVLTTVENNDSTTTSTQDDSKVKEHFRALYSQLGEGAFTDYYFYCGNALVDGFAEESGAVNDTAVTNSAVAPSVDSATGAVSKNHSITNTQYKNIDEGDIIKNDGRYIYLVSGKYGYNLIKIIDTQTMEIVHSGTVKCKDGSDAYIQQIFVNNNTLTVICSENTNYYYSDNVKSAVTFSVVYDISDRHNPKLINTLSQDGSFSSARMIGSVLYTLSSYSVRGGSEEQVLENCIPTVNGEYVGCDCIFIEDEKSVTYVVLTAYDTLKSEKANTLCVLGGGNGVYCSDKTFYAFNTYMQNTKIVAFSINGTDISFKAKGEIPGMANNQYFYDEYNGYLRVATTGYDNNKQASVSSIYILDSNLKQVSCLEDIAKDESVKSVRFMADKGYVVTFRETDPLFTLDLSDVNNPEIMGELKLPGFSNYLHPLSDGLILGFGYDGNLTGADYSSVKISLFDISDLANPKELDSFVIKNADTELHYEAKALIYNEAEKKVMIPITKVGPQYYDGNPRLYVSLKIADGKIEKLNEYNHDMGVSYSRTFRGAYIDDKFYTVCDEYIIEYNIDTAKKIRSCEILTDEEKQVVEVTGTVTTIVSDVIQSSTVPASAPSVSFSDAQ